MVVCGDGQTVCQIFDRFFLELEAGCTESVP